MRRAEQRKAERDSMLYHYREYRRLSEHTTEDGSAVYVLTRPELAPKCFLLAFSGRAGKAAAHYSFRSREAAETYAAQFLAGRKAHAERKSQRRAERSAFKTTLQVGAVLVNSWGYDQTNIDYYQVVRVSGTGRTVTIRQIAARSVEDGPVALSGSCWPLADDFIGHPMVKVVGEGNAVKIHAWGSWAHPWVPKPDRWSAYA